MKLADHSLLVWLAGELARDARRYVMKHLDRAVFAALILGMFGVLLIIAAPAFAQATHGFELTWTDPTERVDGEPFSPADEISQYRAECTRTGSWTDAAFVVFTRDQTTPVQGGRFFAWVNAVDQGGWYDCRMNVADTSGLVSDWSAVVTVRRVAKPNPPVWR